MPESCFHGLGSKTQAHGSGREPLGLQSKLQRIAPQAVLAPCSQPGLTVCTHPASPQECLPSKTQLLSRLGTHLHTHSSANQQPEAVRFLKGKGGCPQGSEPSRGWVELGRPAGAPAMPPSCDKPQRRWQLASTLGSSRNQGPPKGSQNRPAWDHPA